MITKGTWTGQYKYDDKSIHELLGVEATNFEIIITNIENQHFTGSVQDDPLTGGTPGVGEITGTVIGNNIKFIKQMPIRTSFDPAHGRRRTYNNKKHPKIYYSGIFSADGETINGQWKIKLGPVATLLLALLGKKNTGNWTMKSIE